MRNENLISTYDSIPYELSGAMSKNRFRVEVLWGVSKMFDIFDEKEFCVIFDYKCDVEVHLNEKLEFYQIKTHKTQKISSLNNIIKRDKSGTSILGKLCTLKCSARGETKIKLAIVSDTILKANKKLYSDKEQISFSDLDLKSQNELMSFLCEELNIDDFDLSSIHYIYTEINLADPELEIAGKIIRSFENITGEEPIKPNALCRMIISTAHERGAYEFSQKNYSELVKRKGITKSELYDILQRHMKKADDCVKKVYQYIESSYDDVSHKKKMKKSLSTICGDRITSKRLLSKEIEVAEFLYEKEYDSPNTLEDILERLRCKFGNSFGVEYSYEDVEVFLILVIIRWEDGCYE